MRAMLAVACVGVLACDVDNELEYRSTLQAETNGVVLSDDGTVAYAAMAGTTCTIDTRWGCPVADQDLPSDEEAVIDHYLGTTLASSAGVLHVLDGGSWAANDDIVVPDLRDAGLTDDGVIAIHGTTSACWLRRGDGDVLVAGSLCEDGGAAVDRRGAIVKSTSEGVLRVDTEGRTEVLGGGDLVSVDSTHGRTYVATRGRGQVQAIADDGAVLWTLDALDSVQDVAARGERADLLVLSRGADGFGVVRHVAGDTGEVRSSTRIPDAGGELVVSANGHMVALVTDTEVHHFEMMVDGEPVPVSEGEVTCQDLPVRDSSGFATD